MSQTSRRVESKMAKGEKSGNFSITKADNFESYAKTAIIRYKVFVLEQKIPEEIEIENEDMCVHFLALAKGRPAGCIRVRKTKGGLKLERLAVLPEFRKLGLGKALVSRALAHCKRKRGAGKIYMNAQKYLENFYESFGFVPVGKEFKEAGIPHVKMVLGKNA